MALLYITEYATLAVISGTEVPVGQEPGIYQTPVAIGAGSLQSAAFNAETRFVRLHTDAICSVAFGANPTAVAQTQNRMVVGQTEFFGVNPSQKLAVIAST